MTSSRSMECRLSICTGPAYQRASLQSWPWLSSSLLSRGAATSGVGVNGPPLFQPSSFPPLPPPVGCLVAPLNTNTSTRTLLLQPLCSLSPTTQGTREHSSSLKTAPRESNLCPASVLRKRYCLHFCTPHLFIFVIRTYSMFTLSYEKILQVYCLDSVSSGFHNT